MHRSINTDAADAYPIFDLKNAVLYAYMGSTIVLPEGPPSVSRKMFSNPLKAQMSSRVTDTFDTERRDGSVM